MDDNQKEINLALIRKNPDSISLFRDASEVMQLLAVSLNKWDLSHLENPTVKVQMECVRNNPASFLQIKNPTEEVCLDIVKKYPYFIEHVKNPSIDVMDAAINVAPRYFLCFAVEYELTSLVERMLQKNYDPNDCPPDVYNVREKTPFLIAARKKNIEICEILKKYGADIHAEDRSGNAIGNCYTCVKTPYSEIVSLLEMGVSGKDIIDLAVGDHNIPLVTKLIEHKTDLNVHENNRYSLFQSQSDYGSIEMCRLLASGGANIQENKKSGNALVQCIIGKKNGYENKFAVLLDLGVSLTQPDSRGVTPMEVALKDPKVAPIALAYAAKQLVLKTIDEGANTAIKAKPYRGM
jgi:ankyrin repeat protein